MKHPQTCPCASCKHPAGQLLNTAQEREEIISRINNARAWLRDNTHTNTADEAFAERLHEIMAQAESLLLRKHRDYGPKNIAAAPGGALNGLRVRMHDKLARINHLVDSGADPENESLADSFIDLLNYSAIALLVLEGSWPND